MQQHLRLLKMRLIKYLPGDEHSSLFSFTVHDELKKFDDNGNRGEDVQDVNSTSFYNNSEVRIRQMAALVSTFLLYEKRLDCC
jgi:hypothetical protein